MKGTAGAPAQVEGSRRLAGCTPLHRSYGAALTRLEQARTRCSTAGAERSHRIR